MQLEELKGWGEEFAAFHERFADLFEREEPREQAQKYLRSLLASVERKNGWQLAEVSGDQTPDATQRLLYQAKWDADVARDRLLQFVIEVFGDEEGIGVVDETGFIKKGDKSVGVQRQYSGTAGKRENCQIGTFLSYATGQGHVFLDRSLYLPESWSSAPERCAQAKVAANVIFESKPQQAVRMLQHAWEMGVPMRWVTGDEVYGDPSQVRDAVAESGRYYVLAVRTHLTVWRERPEVAVPQWTGNGRKPVKKRVVAAAHPIPIPALAASWPTSQWQRLEVAEGEKGPRIYDWARQRIIENQEQLPGRDAWLLARRSTTDPADVAYYLSNAPAESSLLTLAQVASTRYTIEQCFEEAKGETGLDHYEVRYWHSWYRHITLSMMAHTWLASIRCKQHQKKGIMNLFSPN
jgi:SRSO17 transposase